jgi:hypothetical protein
MPSFHQLRDGTIRIRTDQDTYNMSQEDFAANFGPVPELPAGIDERTYEPGKRHPLSVNSSVMDGGPMPWPEGDDIIARADAVMQAKHDLSTMLDMGGTINEILG